MSPTPQFDVITTERRKRDGDPPDDLPAGRAPQRMDDLQRLLEKTCASFDRRDAAADHLRAKLQKA